MGAPSGMPITESTDFSWTGTPMTGSGYAIEAVMLGRSADLPPAPATITSSPRASAVRA